jgi:hypothetical protein
MVLVDAYSDRPLISVYDSNGERFPVRHIIGDRLSVRKAEEAAGLHAGRNRSYAGRPRDRQGAASSRDTPAQERAGELSAHSPS